MKISSPQGVYSTFNPQGSSIFCFYCRYKVDKPYYLKLSLTSCQEKLCILVGNIRIASLNSDHFSELLKLYWCYPSLVTKLKLVYSMNTFLTSRMILVAVKTISNYDSDLQELDDKFRSLLVLL